MIRKTPRVVSKQKQTLDSGAVIIFIIGVFEKRAILFFDDIITTIS